MSRQDFELRHTMDPRDQPRLICGKCEAPMERLHIEHDGSCPHAVRAPWADREMQLGWDRLAEAIGTAAGAAQHAADVASELQSRMALQAERRLTEITIPEGVTGIAPAEDGLACSFCGSSRNITYVFGKTWAGPRAQCIDEDGCRRRRAAVRLAEQRDALCRHLIDAVRDHEGLASDYDGAQMQAVLGVLQRYGVSLAAS